LAFDLGKRRVGLALSDPLGVTAQGIETFLRTNNREDMERLTALIRERGVALLLLGNPLHMSGRESRQTQHAREFAERLSQAAGVPYQLWDERWTTVEAHRVLHESGMSLEKRLKQVDKLSAVLLLESYLDAVRWAKNEAEDAREAEGGNGLNG
jgi:putative holliday junction resolvase